MKKKYFKLYKKQNENLLSNSKFTASVFYSIKNKKSRYSFFKKPLLSNLINDKEPIPVFKQKSKPINASLIPKQDLFKKQKAKQTFNSINIKNKELLSALVQTKFAKTFKEASFLIKNKRVFINGNILLNKSQFLKEGDVVFISNLKKRDFIKSFFFTKTKETTTIFKYSFRYEISFAGSHFVVCYLFFGQVANRFCIKVANFNLVGSNPILT